MRSKIQILTYTYFAEVESDEEDRICKYLYFFRFFDFKFVVIRNEVILSQVYYKCVNG